LIRVNKAEEKEVGEEMDNKRNRRGKGNGRGKRMRVIVTL
jgi:hypothetical protein